MKDDDIVFTSLTNDDYELFEELKTGIADRERLEIEAAANACFAEALAKLKSKFSQKRNKKNGT